MTLKLGSSAALASSSATITSASTISLYRPKPRPGAKPKTHWGVIAKAIRSNPSPLMTRGVSPTPLLGSIEETLNGEYKCMYLVERGGREGEKEGA